MTTLRRVLSPSVPGRAAAKSVVSSQVFCRSPLLIFDRSGAPPPRAPAPRLRGAEYASATLMLRAFEELGGGTRGDVSSVWPLTNGPPGLARQVWAPRRTSLLQVAIGPLESPKKVCWARPATGTRSSTPRTPISPMCS
eukprot:2168407-Pyramimonas_sp.AAC.1